TLPGLTVSTFEVDKSTAKFDLQLTFLEREGVLEGNLEYSIDLFDAATIAQMISHFETLLQAVVARPEVRLHELQDILIEIDRQERIKKEEEFAEVLRRRLKTTRPKPISASTLIEEAIHRGTNPMKYPPTQTFIIKRQWLERRKAIKTKPAHLSSAELIKIDSCHDSQELPLIVEPNFD